ncbi:Protein hgh1, partial [Xenoophorus captivus]
LPVDLQFLPEDKKREEDPDIRKMLLETLLLLTATKAGRQALKQKNVYPVMREFHRWEKDVYVAAACEKLIQDCSSLFLIMTQSGLVLLWRVLKDPD